jgi:hypothetical protein
VLPREPQRIFRGARQQREELLDPLGAEARGGGELPEEGPELLLQPQNAGGEEVGERHFHVPELLVMRDEAAPLHREAEVVRRLAVPPLVRFGTLQ